MKRCLKRLDFTFRRARRVPEKAVCPKKKQRVQKALRHLRRLEDAGRCQVLYGDESGFCLSPPVPYLWQPKGKTVGLPAQAHSRRLNVLGFLSRQGSLCHFQAPKQVTTQFVIECIETLLPALCRPTVLVQAKRREWKRNWCKPSAANGNEREWKRKGLRLLFLPPYCPHLNLIETLWR